MVLFGVLTAALSFGAAPATASAPKAGSVVTPNNHITYNFHHYLIVNYATGRCLDSNAAESAYTLPCNRGGYQQWDGVFLPSVPHGGAYLLEDEATTYCLWAPGFFSFANVWTTHCADQSIDPASIDWHITYGSSLAYQLHPENAVGKAPGGADYCLDSDAAGELYLNPCQPTNAYQNWYLEGD